MYEFHPTDLVGGTDPGSLLHGQIQMIALGPDWTLTNVQNAGFRPMFLTSEEGKKTGVQYTVLYLILFLLYSI